MNVTLYKPYPHQRVVHDAITHHIKTARRFTDAFQVIFTVKAPRQTGKSIMIENELLRWALQFKGSINGYVAPSFDLTDKVFTELVDMLEGTGLLASKNIVKKYIRLVNGSTIRMFSAEQRNRLRGYTITGVLMIDEAAFMVDDIFHSHLSPWVDAKKAVIIMISSPNFETGFFYDTYIDGLENGHSFDFTDYDLSMVRSPEKLEEKRRTTPPQVFRSEYLGLFKRAEGTVFGPFEACLMKHEAETPTEMYFGIDFGTGSGKDYTVVTAFNQHHEQCFLWATNEMQPMDQAKEIANILSRFKGVTRGVYAEQNSIGKIYLDMLRKHTQVSAFNTDNKSKRKLVEQMQVDIQQVAIGLIDDFKLKNEFAIYESHVNPATNLVTYGAPKQYNDDMVMATMIANHCYHKRKNRSTRISIL